MSEHTKVFADSVASGRKQPLIEREALRRELNAARALLREVIGPKAGDWYTLERRVEAYLDACDKPGEPT